MTLTAARQVLGTRARLGAALVAALGGLGCGGPPGPPTATAPAPAPVSQRPADSASVLLEPAAVGRLVVLEVQLPEAGAAIGGEFDGITFMRQVSSLRMSEAMRHAWAADARLAGDSALRAAGYIVHDPLSPSSDAAPLRGVRFGISAIVTTLYVTSSVRADLRASARVQVAWELLDLSVGAPVFEGRTEGLVRNRDSLGQAVTGALARALAELLETQAFIQALSRPRPINAQTMLFAEFTRRLPGEHDTIRLTPGPRVPSEQASALAGVVRVNGTRGFRATAIILDASGLALTNAAVGRQTWLWARLSDGSSRAVRVLRVIGDLALIELACLEACPTVAWIPAPVLPDRLPVFVVSPLPLGIAHTRTRVRERRVGDAPQWWVRIRPRPVGGEAVVRMADGLVVAVTTPTRVVPLAEAFASLNVAVGPR